MATIYRDRLQDLGIKVAGFEKWDAKASSSEAIGSRIKASGADAIFLGGIVCNNGGKLIKDLRAAYLAAEIILVVFAAGIIIEMMRLTTGTGL